MLQRVEAHDPRFSYGDMRLVPMLEITIPWDSETLGNLPVRSDAPATITPETDLQAWLDNDVLQTYGVAVKRADDLGNLVAYVPLNTVVDQIGGARVAFSARVPYRPVAAQWGKAHQLRVVWLVHALTDVCTAQGDNGQCTAWSLDNEQIVQSYYEEFTLAGISVREEQGVDLAVVYETTPVLMDAREPFPLTPLSHSDGSFEMVPDQAGLGLPPTPLSHSDGRGAGGEGLSDPALWSLADKLESTFVNARDSDGDGQRDITVSEIQRRFNHATNGALPIETRWGISNTLSVVTRHYDSRDAMLTALMATDVEQILSNAFTPADTPTLLFASEETYRAGTLDRQTTVDQESITIEMDTAVPETLAAVRWRPYAYVGGAWASQPLETYLDNLSQRVQDDDPFFDPDGPGNDGQGVELKLDLLRSTYLSLAQGVSSVVQQGNTPLTHAGPVAVDDESLMQEELAVGRQFGGYSKYVVRAAYMLRDWYTNRQAEQMMARLGYQTVEDTGGLGRALDKLFLGVQEQWQMLEIGVQLRWEAMSLTARVGAVAGAGVVLAGIGVGLYFLFSSDRATADKIQIITSSVMVVMSTVSAVSTVSKIVEAGKTASTLTERLEAASEEVTDEAKTAAVVGAIVAVGITVGFFIYSIVSAGVTVGSLQFDAALANTIATCVAQVIMIAIAFIPVVGQIIAVVLGLIDAVVSLVCGIVGADAESSPVCAGITGWLAKGIAWAIYGQHVMIDLDDADRLQTYDFGTTFAADSNGFAYGSQLSYHLSVTNTVSKAGFPASALSLPYFWQWTDSRAKTSAFAYSLTEEQQDIDDVSRGDTSWTGDDPFVMSKVVTSHAIPLPEPGINRTVDGLTLNEGYSVPAQECWGLLIASVCYIRDNSDTNNIEVGKNLRFDIFPSTLDGFYSLVEKNGGYALAWGQSDAVTFPRLQDADGDGLRSRAVGGADPNDSRWDTDGDGLSDPFEQQSGTDPDNADTDGDGLEDRQELMAGTNPYLADSDGDGLTDSEELDGWLFVYGFDGDTPLMTRVWPDPLQVDADQDGYSDVRERIFGFHPRVPSTGDILTLESQIDELTATGSYTSTDGYIRPGGRLHYEATVSNHLAERYAQGLLQTVFPPAAQDSLMPQSFVLHPEDQTTLAGDITLAASADSGLVDLTQVAQAQITDPRDLLGAPRIWLTFDEGAGTTSFADTAGISPAYGATCTGESCPTAGGPGAVGNAVSFDGVNDSLTLASGFAFGTDTAAISAWVRPNSVDGTQAILVRGDTDNSHGLAFGIVDGQVWVGGSSGTGWVGKYAGTVSTGEWTHLAAVYREYTTAYWDIHRCEVYVNGEHVETFPDCDFQLDGTGYVTRIGRNHVSDIQHFDGLIDDLRIYTHAPTGWHLPALQLSFDQMPPTDASDYNNLVSCEPRCLGLVTGVSGSAAGFDGHHYLEASLPGLTFDQYTMSAWIYPQDSGNSTIDATSQSVIGVSVTYPNASPYVVVAGNRLRVGFGTGRELLQFTTGDILTRNAWNHVAVTFGETEGMFHVYVDGVLRGSYDAGDSRVFQGSYASHMTQIGGGGQPGDFSGSSTMRLFYGKLDDLVIYREALAADEVNELYQSGAEAVVLGLDDPPGGTRSSDTPDTAYLQNAADATGLHNGTCRGSACPTLGVAGREFRAALFDGVDDVITLDNTNDSTFTFDGSPAVPFSLAAWVYPRSGGGTVVGKFDSGREGAYFLRIQDDGSVEFHREAPPYNLITGTGVAFDQWSHVAATYDGSTMRVYINGTLVGQMADTGAVPTSPNTPVTVGALYNNGSLDSFFDGMLDDVRVYRRALNVADVAALYDSAPSLQLAFDEPTGAGTFADAAGGLDATCDAGACPSAGVKGQVSLAIDLDGVTEHISVPDDNALDFSAGQDFAVALWMKAAAAQPDTGAVGNSIVDKGSSGAHYPYTLQMANDGRVVASRSDGTHLPQVTSAYAANDGLFHHIALVKSGETLTLYVDGEVSGSASDSTSGTTTNTSALYVGQRDDGTGHFAGTVDELLVFQRALSLYEVRDLFRAQAALVEDRQHTYITVDADPPSSQLASDHAYRQLGSSMLFVSAGDAHSGIDHVDVAINGTWEAAPPCQDAVAGTGFCPIFDPAGEGRYRLQTRATDLAGNVETPAAATIIHVDGTPPQITIGASDGTRLNLVADPTEATGWLLPLDGTVQDPVLNGGDPGSGVARVEVMLDGSTGTSELAGVRQATLTGGNWHLTYSFHEPEPDGVFTVQARAIDIVGNAGPWATVTVQIDGSAPEASAAFPRTTAGNTLSATSAITQSGILLSGTVSDVVGSVRTGVSGIDVAFSPNVPGSPVVNERPPAGEVLHWSLDDMPNQYGTLTFVDISGAGNNGGCVGTCPTYGVAGHQGQAVAFDEADSAITVRSPHGLAQGNAPYSLAAWIDLTDIKAQDILRLGADSLSIHQVRKCVDLWLFTFCYNAGHTLVYGDYQSGLAVTADDLEGWHHVTVTYDGVTWSLYVDGRLGDQDGSAGAEPPVTPALQVGGQGFDGRLDDVRIFARSLSGGEVGDVYRGSDPALMLMFDESRLWPDSTSVADTSGWQQQVEVHAGPGNALATMPGKVGTYALSFDGVDDYLVADGVSRVLGDTRALSFGGWVLPLPHTGEDGEIAAFNTGDGGNRNMLLYDATQQKFGYYDDAVHTQLSQDTFAPGAWYYVMLTIDVDDRVVLYVDGMPQLELTTSVRPAPDGRFSIGQEWDGNTPTNFFKGALDNVRVDPRALMSTEIGMLAAGGWRPAQIVTTGPDTADWSYTVPAGLEGHFQLDLRGIDGAGNVDRHDAGKWSGSVDTLAPRVDLTRQTVAGGILYTTVAQDFNLAEDGFNSPCGPGAITGRQAYASPWYLGRIAQSDTTHQRLFQLTANCVLSQAVAEKATACDAYGHCATVTQAAAMTSSGLSRLATPAPMDIVFTDVPATLLSIAPVTLTGSISATEALAALTVTVGSSDQSAGRVIHETTWTMPEDARQATWTALWTPPAEGSYILQALASDWAGNVVSATARSPILVDVTPPAIDATDVLTGDAHTPAGYLLFRGTVSDTVGIDHVVVTAINGPLDSPIDAAVLGTSWQAAWAAGFDRDLDGVTYNVTVRATDLVGRETETTEPVTIDVVPPPPAAVTLRNAQTAAELQPGATITTADGLLRLEWTTPGDGSGLGNSVVVWSITTGDEVTQTVTTHVPGGSRFSELAVDEPQQVSVRLGRTDIYGNTRWQSAGPVTIDGPLTPDYLAPLGDAWLDSGCTLLGVDARGQRQAAANTSLDVLQRFYTTWNSDALAFSWIGANWESDGDLFITFDVADSVTPQASGSVRAYDPFTATYTNTAILLPYDGATSTQMTADYVLWIKNSTDVSLMAWDGSTGTWKEMPAGPGGLRSEGLIYTFQPTPEGGLTDILLPFALLGITDPANTGLSMVALASEDDALRLWATMPPRNSLNSDRVIEAGPPGIHQFALQQAYHWDGLGPGICPNGVLDGGPVRLQRADVSFELSADPPGVAYHLLRDDLFYLMDQLDQFDTHDWRTVQDELCEVNPDDPLCDRAITRGTAAQMTPSGTVSLDGGITVPPPPGFGVAPSVALAATGVNPSLQPRMDTDHPAVGDGQRITYALRYTNLGDEPVRGLKVEVTTEGPLHLLAGQTLTGADGEYDWLQLDLGDLAPGEHKSVMFVGQVDLGFGETGKELASIDAVAYDETGTAFTNQHEWLYLDHEVDETGPEVGIRALPPLVPAGDTLIGGYTFDQSPVPTITLQVRLPNGWEFEQSCPGVPGTDTVLSNGKWECVWNAPELQDGDVLQLRARGTDSHGNIGAWTRWISVTQDLTPPELALSAATSRALADGVLGPDELALKGTLTDNTLVASVEACRSAGGVETCSPVPFTRDAATTPQTTFVYDDVPATPLPMGALTPCDPGGTLIRTFAVKESFAVAGVEVGLNVDHDDRADVRAWLVSPSGSWISLAYGGTPAHNLNALLVDAAAIPLIDDTGDHLTSAPFYTLARRPRQPLTLFDGEPAQGYWHLVLCEATSAEADGAYRRSRLILTSDTVPQQTQGAWVYRVPASTAGDGVSHSVRFYGLDSVGNRTSGNEALAITYRVDTVAPSITATQVATAIPHLGTHPVLVGKVSDGEGIGSLLLHVQTPGGAVYTEHLSREADGKWSASLSPSMPGVYTLNVYATDLVGNTRSIGPYDVTVFLNQVFLPFIAKH